jgi:hypothetical protein
LFENNVIIIPFNGSFTYLTATSIQQVDSVRLPRYAWKAQRHVVKCFKNVPKYSTVILLYFCYSQYILYDVHRRKIRLIEGNAKCRYLQKKITCKGTLRQVIICLRTRTPYPPPPYTRYTCMYTVYSRREGGGEGEDLNQREGLRGNSSKSWV